MLRRYIEALLKVCKYCDHFTECKGRNKYLCDKHNCHIHMAKCSKTASIQEAYQKDLAAEAMEI